jgi:hypothetical protein
VVRRVTVVGLASGLFNTAQQLASSIGLAVLASLATTQTEALIGSGHSTRDALASGYGRGFLGAAICVLVALALAAILLPRPPADQTSRESPGCVMRSSPYSRVPVSERLTEHVTDDHRSLWSSRRRIRYRALSTLRLSGRDAELG